MQTVSLTVASQQPVTKPDAYSGTEDTLLTVDAAHGVLANDTDPDSPSITAKLVSPPAHGTVTLNADGSFSYQPAANYNGSDSFAYLATDGVAALSPTTVSITLAAVQDPPIGVADSYSLAEDTPLTTTTANGVLKNDSDPDGDAITAVLVTPPAFGTLTFNANGTFTYSPKQNYNGSDSFTYQASDGTRLSNPVTVSLTITPVNNAPVAVARFVHHRHFQHVCCQCRSVDKRFRRRWRSTDCASYCRPEIGNAVAECERLVHVHAGGQFHLDRFVYLSGLRRQIGIGHHHGPVDRPVGNDHDHEHRDHGCGAIGGRLV